MSFVGHYTHALDAKNRLFVPAKYREDLGEVFYITRKLDAFLSIYTEDEWNKCVETLAELPESSASDYQEIVLGNAQKCTPDSHGRILIDEGLLEYAQITKNAVFVGVGHQIRLFAEEVWNERNRNRDYEQMKKFLAENRL